MYKSSRVAEVKFCFRAVPPVSEKGTKSISRYLSYLTKNVVVIPYRAVVSSL